MTSQRNVSARLRFGWSTLLLSAAAGCAWLGTALAPQHVTAQDKLGAQNNVAAQDSVQSASATATVEVEAKSAGTTFSVTLDKSLSEQPITGRLFVFLSQGGFGQPMNGPNWFRPQPFYGLDVKDMAPGEAVTMDDKAAGFPGKLSQLAPGNYRAQALLDHDFYNSTPADGEGNFYSDPIDIVITADGAAKPISFQLTHAVEPTQFRESEFAKEVVIKSELLSDFHGREVIDKCGIVLPPSYFNEPQRRYPVIYHVPGFGGTHYSAARAGGRGGRGRGGNAPSADEEFINVYLSGQCKWGHHVYADSATNGPRGASLTQEMIPYIDQHYRTVPETTARFLTGHSSGGWSTLWLQVAYPDVFGGTWSTAPDPVDFRDFQLINIYAPGELMFVDPEGKRRPLARQRVGDGTAIPVLWYDDFSKMDDVVKRGGQLRSFEAVFSPRGADGEPLKLWNRETGELNAEVAKAWEAYDINLVLQRNWDTLGPKLAGKLHVFTGSLDTFYLDGAVVKLKKTLEDLKSDAVVEIVPGEDHGSLMTPDLRARITREMSESFRAHHAQKVGN